MPYFNPQSEEWYAALAGVDEMRARARRRREAAEEEGTTPEEPAHGSDPTGKDE
jgi:hypothetical protein